MIRSKNVAGTLLGSRAVGFAEMTTTLADRRLLFMYSNETISNNDFREIRNLSQQIKALQRAWAIERGENHRFREEVRALLRSGRDE